MCPQVTFRGETKKWKKLFPIFPSTVEKSLRPLQTIHGNLNGKNGNGNKNDGQWWHKQSGLQDCRKNGDVRTSISPTMILSPWNYDVFQCQEKTWQCTLGVGGGCCCTSLYSKFTHVQSATSPTGILNETKSSRKRFILRQIRLRQHQYFTLRFISSYSPRLKQKSLFSMKILSCLAYLLLPMDIVQVA